MSAIDLVREPGDRPRGPDRALYDRFLPLVRRIAMRTVRTLPASVSVDDLVSAGWLGLVESLQRRTEAMDDEQFEAFASYRIRGAILDHLRSLDPLSRKLRGASRRITDAIADLTARLGRAPEEEEVSAEVGVDVETYRQLLADISEAGFARLEVTALTEPVAPDASPEQLVTQRELVDTAARAIEDLPERLKLVLSLHYQEDCTFREIGEILGVTESRVCQLHSETVHRLRATIEGRAPRKGKKK